MERGDEEHKNILDTGFGWHPGPGVEQWEVALVAVGGVSELGGTSKLSRDQIRKRLRDWDLGGRCCLAQGGVSVKGKKNQELGLQREGFPFISGRALEGLARAQAVSHLSAPSLPSELQGPHPHRLCNICLAFCPLRQKHA